MHFGVLNYEKQHKQGTCTVSGRSVVFSTFYADFCLCPKLLTITTLITDDFQDTYPFQQTPFCTDTVRKSRVESCFARLESDMVCHHEKCSWVFVDELEEPR